MIFQMQNKFKFYYAKTRTIIVMRSIIFFFMFFLLSCNKLEMQRFKIDSKNPEKTYLQITNNGEVNSTFSIVINCRSTYSEDKIIEFIKDNISGKTDSEKVWRFVSLFTQHKENITPNNWNMDPLIQINSSGGGNCGNRSAVMTNLLCAIGKQAVSWCIDGHVVCESFENGKCQLFDPDLGVIYYNSNGDICSFSELCNNPNLISSPISMMCISNLCDSLQASCASLARKYSTKENNIVFGVDYEKNEKTDNLTFDMPPGSNLSFPIIEKTNGEYCALALLSIPPNWNGSVKTMLIPYDIEGNATIYYSNNNITGGKNQISEIISKNQIFEYEINISDNTDGVELYYRINPLIYHLEAENKIEIIGENISCLNLAIKQNNIYNISEISNSCDTIINFWNQFASNCEDCLSQKVNNYYNLISKVKIFEECGGFETIQIHPQETYTYLDTALVYSKEQDSLFWNKFNQLEFFISRLYDINNDIQSIKR